MGAITSERWAASDRNRWAAYVRIRSFETGKKIKGKKRHLLVDTQGLVLNAVVHSAALQNRDGGVLVMATLLDVVRHIDLEIVKRSDTGKALRCCQNDRSSSAPSAGSTAAAGWQRTGNA